MNITMEQNNQSQPDTQTNRTMTFGEKLVGLTFNPSGDPKVHRAKELCAELADLVMEVSKERSQTFKTLNDVSDYDSFLIKRFVLEDAIQEILKAQMLTVKYLTFNG
jgi:hypothetical protein